MGLTPTQSFIIPVGCAIISSFAAFHIKNKSKVLRFITGFIAFLFQQRLWWKLAENIKPIICGDLPPKYVPLWTLLHAFMMLLIINSCIGFFGSNKYYNKHHIKSRYEAMVASLIPGQTFFTQKNGKNKDNNDSTSYRTLLIIVAKHIASIACAIAIINTIKAYHVVDDIIERPILHMVVLAIIIAFSVVVQNFPSLILNILFKDKLKIIPPYALLPFLSASPRHFWKSWSRPLGEFLRFAIYEPLGGRNYPVLSTLSAFLFNCKFHYDVSRQIYGVGVDGADESKIKSGWGKAYAVLGVVCCAQIVAEKNLHKKWKETLLWKCFWFGVFHASVIIALYSIYEHAFVMDLKFMIELQ